MTWLHTYLGVFCGWLLFAIFVTGTLSYFTPEMTRYLMPERHVISLPQDALIDHSFAFLKENASDADEWRVHLPTDRNAHWYVQWRKDKSRKKVTFNADTAALEKETETKGGLFFRNFHYTLQLRGYGGRYIVGIAAMAMLLAIFTGIFTHRRFFRDFFTLRPHKLKKWLTDFHALAGILTLPFCIMICVSGIFIYAIMYMPYAANSHFERGEKGVNKQIIPSLALLPPAQKVQEQTQIQISRITSTLAKTWQEPNPIAKITVEKPQFSNSRTIVERSKATTVSNRAERAVFHSYTGDVLPGYENETVPAQIRRVLYGLHQANYAPIGMRWLLFALGVAGCALIATGNIIWVNQRKKSNKQSRLTLALMEKGNVAAIMGLVLACITFFLANKLLPETMAMRSEWEINSFFIVWLASFHHALYSGSARRAWYQQTLLASLFCFSLVMIELSMYFSRIQHGVITGDMTYLSFIPAFLVFGGLLLILARKFRRHGAGQ